MWKTCGWTKVDCTLIRIARERCHYMSESNTTDEHLAEILSALGNSEPHIREKARDNLLEMGSDVTPFLIGLLSDPNENSRWEAAKILGETRDPQAAAALVKSLMDENVGVRWLAAEALIALEGEAVVPLLQGLLAHFDDVWFRQGALHVLRTLDRFHSLDPLGQEVLEALSTVEPGVTAPWAAERALEYYLKLSKSDERSG